MRYSDHSGAEVYRPGICSERWRCVCHVLVYRWHQDVVLPGQLMFYNFDVIVVDHHLFVKRSDIPADITSEKPDPKTWTTPTASFPANGCDPRSFNPQNMIINIDVCGNWAGDKGVYPATGCTGLCTDVIAKGSNYDNAYWEIKYVKTFTTTPGNGTTTTSSGSNHDATNGTTSSSSPDEKSTKPSSAISSRMTRDLWTAAGFALIAFGLSV